MSMINLKDYLQKQIKFSIGNLASVPVGTGLLFALTHFLGIWYIYSSLLSMICTTLMNFWVSYFLRVIRIEKRTPIAQAP